MCLYVCMNICDKRRNCHPLFCSISYITPTYFHPISINSKACVTSMYMYIYIYVKEIERDKTHFPFSSASFFCKIKYQKKKYTQCLSHENWIDLRTMKWCRQIHVLSMCAWVQRSRIVAEYSVGFFALWALHPTAWKKK